MSWKRGIGWAVFVLAILIVIAGIGGHFYLKSSSFQKYALNKIAEEADAETGGKTTIRRLDLSPLKLTATLYDITLRGKEGPGQPPLLRADKLTVRAKIFSAPHHQIWLRELLIDHPVVHVQVNRQGTSNLPTAPPSQSSSHTNVFDLAVGHVGITNGEVDYNDRKTPLAADLYDLTTDIRYSDLPKAYNGTLSYRNGHVSYRGHAPLPHALDLRFSATPKKLDVRSIVLRVGSSDIALQAQVANYSDPVVDGDYQVRLHTQDFSDLSPGAQVAGDVSLTGKIHYQSIADQPLLRSVSVDGRIASQALTAIASGRRAELRNPEGQYHLAGGNLQVRNVKVETLGGRVTVNAAINHLDATPESTVSASLQSISLRALQQLSGARPAASAALSGTISGKAEASWKGSIEKLKARLDLSVQAKAESKANPSAKEVPVNGAIHAAYDGAHGAIQLQDTVLRMPSANLTAQGTISDRSRLQVNLVAGDLHALAAIASSFRSGQAATPAISGKVTLNATAQGSMKNPRVEAQLSAEDLLVEGSRWSSAKMTLHADPSQFSVQNGSLVNAQKGRASFSASVKLHSWSYDPHDAIQGKLDAQQIRIADLLQVANQRYPVSGDLTAHLSLDGSQLNPAGSGQIEIANANVYGEPLDQLRTKIRAADGVISTTMTASAKAGTINADLDYTAKSKAYQLRIDAPGIVLQKLRTLQAKNLPITGTLRASVSGQGTVDDPQLDATVELPELQAQGRSISELKAVAKVAQHKLDLNLDSKVIQVPIHARVAVALTGEFDTDASIDTGAVPLDAIVATYAPSIPAGFQGQTELHAALKGPLKDESRVEAHLSIPVLKASYQSLQIGIAKPIRADYANSVITLQPADIEGTDTSLHVEGRLPVGRQSAPTLTAQGSVDLRIVRIVAPDVASSGTLAVNVQSSGSASQPGVKGQLQLKNVALSTADAPIGIEKLNGTIDISNDRWQILQMTGQMGGGQLTLSGTATYRPSLQFNLAAQTQSVRFLYPDGLRASLDANLAFSGTTSDSTLSGRVLIDSLSFTPDFDLASFSDQFSAGTTVSQPGFADTVHLAIGVQSRENLNATSSQVSLEGQAALQVGGTVADPVLTGRTTLNSGELFYRNVRYQLQRGVITFDDPNQTHPVLNVSVTTTIEQYNLTLNLRGPLDKLTTSYVSEPPLAQADIINLVARGKTTQESAAASSQSTDSMIASQAASQLSSSVQKLAGISSLQIDPTLGGNNQNPSARVAIQQRVTRSLLFTFSTDVSQPGSEIVQGEYQINKRWSVSVARDQLGGVSVDGRYRKRF